METDRRSGAATLYGRPLHGVPVRFVQFRHANRRRLCGLRLLPHQSENRERSRGWPLELGGWHRLVSGAPLAVRRRVEAASKVIRTGNEAPRPVTRAPEESPRAFYPPLTSHLQTVAQKLK